jgi:hypothetical protein
MPITMSCGDSPALDPVSCIIKKGGFIFPILRLFIPYKLANARIIEIELSSSFASLAKASSRALSKRKNLC